jgi:hypothetical protein
VKTTRAPLLLSHRSSREWAFESIAEALPGTKEIVVRGEINEDWIPRLRVQRVADANGGVLFDVESAHDPGVGATIDGVNAEYLDVLVELTGEDFLGTTTIEQPMAGIG